LNAPHVLMTTPPGYESKVAHIPNKLRRLCVAMTPLRPAPPPGVDR
jgi:hypothetical protein